MIGRVIIALLMIAAAAIVTMERETAVVADMTADLAESKYTDAEERAKRYEERAKDAEAKLTEIEAKNKWLEGEIAEANRLRDLALLPLEVKVVQPSMKGALDNNELLRVAHANAVNTCFARAPTRGPDVTMRWVVQADGRPTNVAAADVPPGFDDVVDCLRTSIASWRFPPSKVGLSLAQLTWDTKAPDDR
jgi:hypothetical protein